MIGNAILIAVAALYLLGLLLGALLDPAWLWLAVAPVGLGLIVWAMVRVAETTLKGLKIP